MGRHHIEVDSYSIQVLSLIPGCSSRHWCQQFSVGHNFGSDMGQCMQPEPHSWKPQIGSQFSEALPLRSQFAEAMTPRSSRTCCSSRTCQLGQHKSMALHVSHRTCAVDVDQVKMVCFDCGVCTLLGTQSCARTVVGYSYCKLELIATGFHRM